MELKNLRSPDHQGGHIICGSQVNVRNRDRNFSGLSHVISFVFPSVLTLVVFMMAHTPALPSISHAFRFLSSCLDTHHARPKE